MNVLQECSELLSNALEMRMRKVVPVYTVTTHEAVEVQLHSFFSALDERG
jgi:hypothetical protein